MSEQEVTQYDPIGIAPVAEGWRAYYSLPDSDGFTQPLVAWGVFRVTVRQVGTDKVLRDAGTTIEGVVTDTSNPGVVEVLTCARQANFVGYVAPGVEV